MNYTVTNFTAIIILLGGPSEPEVKYEILLKQREVLLSWPRPFTWKNYPISGYHIKCTDKDILYVAENRTFARKTIPLPRDIPDCHTLQCNVTAFNSLAESTPSVTDIPIPLSECCVQ